MYKNLIKKLKETFQGITAVKVVYAKPLEGSVKTYPAVQFAFSDSNNTWETNQEDRKVLVFNISARFSLAGITEANDTVFYEETVPNFVDKVYAEFEENWGGEIGGSPLWWILNNGQPYIDPLEKGKELIIPFKLEVKVVKEI